LINGRAFTTTGNLSTNAVTVTSPPGCIGLGMNAPVPVTEAVTVYPNPFKGNTNFIVNDPQFVNDNTEIKIYDVLGQQLLVVLVLNTTTTIDMGGLPSGIYFYTIVNQHQTIQSGRLISQ